jgi:hypothetical protein
LFRARSAATSPSMSTLLRCAGLKPLTADTAALLASPSDIAAVHDDDDDDSDDDDDDDEEEKDDDDNDDDVVTAARMYTRSDSAVAGRQAIAAG